MGSPKVEFGIFSELWRESVSEIQVHVTTGIMKNMSEENKENPSVKNRQPISDLLMKPFSLGWTREVVRRVVKHLGTPNCDIYYFNPNKKKLRSSIEVKSNLTDGLSIECFSFKREPLGLSPDLEVVRDAKARGKGGDKSKEKRKLREALKKPAHPESAEEETEDGEKKAKRRKTAAEEYGEEEDEDGEEGKEKEQEAEGEDSKSHAKKVEGEVKPETVDGDEDEVKKEEDSEESVTKSRRTKSEGKDSKESKGFVSKNKGKAKGAQAKATKPVRLQSVKKRKSALKRVMSAKQAKQAKVVPNRKPIKGIVRKKVATANRKLSKIQKEKKGGLKSKKNSSKMKTGEKAVKNGLATKGKSDVAKAPETNDAERKPTARDLKSIVKKNIGKYREMREKQKLGAVKNQARNANKRLSISSIPRMRSEPISKNKPFYLKPLEKGWRRELVYRTNCAKAGQQADVYYFHPSGKKLRSCREIAENLTHGLTIEYFTFRKEPLGCGEPSEVVRNARSFQKN